MFLIFEEKQIVFFIFFIINIFSEFGNRENFYILKNDKSVESYYCGFRYSSIKKFLIRYISFLFI